MNNYREDKQEIRCGGEYGNGVKEFLGCARAQCDSERAQMGGGKKETQEWKEWRKPEEPVRKQRSDERDQQR